ncbi:MAG: hypothetical protein ACK2T0_06125 [Anaerolineales bacterium]|jgi:hypothetical protein
MRRFALGLAGIAMGLALGGCNLPGAQATPTLSVLDQAATIVAGTLGAGGISTAAPQAATPSPTTAVTATATTKPTLFINTDGAKCRSGAGTDFKEIASFAVGTTVDMIAKDTSDGYWFVKDPTSGSSCWVSVQDATPSGSFDLLPEITPPPVAVEPPGKPGKGSWNYSCDDTSFTAILGWTAPQGNVNGYRVYRDGTQVANLPSSTTTYTETIDFVYGSSVSYSVEAFNEAGAGPQVTWDISCP